MVVVLIVMDVNIWFFILPAEKEILTDYFVKKHKKLTLFL
jgi:uncharacterized membrane protein|tara:strand:- start:1064 stop:1183 length:120 start_codon:yes stop_codon:yes gene_type:complete